MANLLTLPVFTDIILPFLFIFTLIFAILEKSKLLGDDKHQINAITGFVVGAILISFANAIDIITQMTVFMAVSLVILFVFLLIYGFVYNGKDGEIMGKGLKTLLGIIIFIAVVIAVLFATNSWDKVYDFFTSSDAGANIIFIVLIAAAIAAVVWKKKD
jgi:hypothetical protein